jgi:hypothetical protein
MTEQRRDDRVTDAAVDAAWRQAAGEQPPAEIDAAILAAARAAVRRDTKERLPAPLPRRRANWQPLAAAAGVIGLSFLLVQMLPRDQPARSPANEESPPPAAESATPAAESAPTLTPPQPATRNAASLATAERETTAGAAPPAAMDAAAKQSVPARVESPEAWVSRIAALHEDGDLAAAEAELRAFRAARADADSFLPEQLRAWAASVDRDGTP